MKKVFMAMAIVAAMLAAASCACCNNSGENAECATECVEETKAPCDSAKCAACDSTACCPNAQ